MSYVSCVRDSFVCVCDPHSDLNLSLICARNGPHDATSLSPSLSLFLSLSLPLRIEISFVKAASSSVLVMQILTCRFGLVAIN